MKGISPLVGMVLVVAFGFASMALVLTVVNPLLDKAKDSGIINEATQNMQLLDSAIKTVATEPKGSKRTFHIKITEGILRTNSSNEQVFLEYEPRTRTILDGFSGDVRIESRPIFLEYFNKYNEDANASDAWTAVNGSWRISGGRFLGNGGIAYHNVGNQSSFDIAATIVKSSAPDGQMYVVPGEPRDLILYIPFDGNVNTTITTAYDYSAYKRNGTLTNITSATCFTNNACPDWVTGKFGNGTKFDGVGDWIDTPLSLNSLNTAISYGGWFKADGIDTTCRAIIRDASFADFNLCVNQSGGNYYVGEQTGAGGLRLNATLSNPFDWHHTMVTKPSGSSTFTLYLDGKSIDTQTGAVGDRTANMEIGGIGSSTVSFNGTLDEIMIFNRVLTAQEIAFVYESSAKKVTTGGDIQTISPSFLGSMNTTIVLAAPGSSYFDNVKLKSGGTPKIHFLVPYQNIDVVNNTRFGPGDHSIVIKHFGTNTTSNRPMIGLEE